MKAIKSKKSLKPLDYKQATLIKKGQKYALIDASYESKSGDIVTVTKAENPGSDYEHIRISNGFGTWRVSSSGLSLIS